MSPAVAAAILVISLSTQAFAAPYICTTCQTSNTRRIYQTQTGGFDNLSQRSENLEDLTQHAESELSTSRNQLAFDNARPGNWTDVNRYRTPDGHGQVYEEQGQRVQGPSRVRFYKKNFSSSYSSGNSAGSETPDLAGFGSYDSQLASHQSTLNQAASQQSFGQTGNSAFQQTVSHGNLYGSHPDPVDSTGGSSSYRRGSGGYLREDESTFDRQSTQQRESVTGEQRPGNWSRVNSYRTNGGNGRVHEEQGQFVTGPRQVRYFRKNYTSSYNSGGAVPTFDGQSGGLDLERVVQELQREINSQGREIHQIDQNVVNGGHVHQTSEYHRGTGVPSDQTNQRYLLNSDNYGSQNRDTSGSQLHHTYEFHHGQDYSHHNHGGDSDEDFGHNHNHDHDHHHNHRHQNQYYTHGHSTGGYSDTSGYDNQGTQQVLTVGEIERVRPLNPQSGSQYGQVFQSQELGNGRVSGSSGHDQVQTSTSNFNHEHGTYHSGSYGTGVQQSGLSQHHEELQRPAPTTPRRPNIDRRFAEVHEDQRTQQTINQNYNRNYGIRSGELVTHGLDLGQIPLDTDTTHSGHVVHTQSCQHSGQQRLYRRNLKHDDYLQQTEDLHQQAEDLTQQTENLTQQTEDLTQQTEDLTQQTQQSQDLTQQTEDLTQKTQDLTQQTEDLTQQTEDLTQQTQQITQQSEDLTQQTQDLTQQTQDFTQQSEDLTQQTQDFTQQTQDITQQSQDLTQQTEDLTQQTEDLTQQTQDLTQQTQDLTQQTQDFTQQTQDLTQQTQDFTQQTQDITQQSQDLTQQTEDLTQQTEDLTQQTQDLTQQTQDFTQQTQDLTQQTQDFTQQTQDITQQSQDLTQQTEDLTQQTEDLTQQTQDLTQQTQDFTQQTQDLTQQTQDLTQQTEDLTQQTQSEIQQGFQQDDWRHWRYHEQIGDPNYVPYVQKPVAIIYEKYVTPEEQNSGDQQKRDSAQKIEDLTQQTQDFQQSQDLFQQTEDLGQQTEDLTQQTEDLTQQTEDLTQQTQDFAPQSENLNQQTEDLTQQTEDLTQQTEDLGQQTEDLTQQTEDLTQQTQDFAPQSENLNQQTEDLTQQTEDLTQQTEDLTQQTEDLGQQTEDLTQQTEDLTQQTQDFAPQSENLNQQTEDLTQQTEDLTQQTEDLTQQTEDLSQQTEDLTQQTEDLTQQTEDLTQQTQDFAPQSENLNQQPEDLTQQTEDLTQQTEDLGQQTEDLTQQTEDLTQQTQDFAPQSENLNQQTEDLTQQTEDLGQQTQDFTQQSQDLFQQTEDLTHQTQDLTQQTQDFAPQSENLNQQTEDLTQQTEDLTQQTEDLTQQTQDFQQSQDLFQQTEDLSQQTQDLTQQTEDLTQQTENLNQQTEDLYQQAGFIDDYTNQRTSSSQFLQQETSRNIQQVVQQPNKPAPKPKRIKPLNPRDRQQITIDQEDAPVIFSGRQPIPQNTGESRIPPRSHRGDQSIEANSDSSESGSDESESEEREVPQVQQQPKDLENHHSPPVQATTSQNQFRQVQGIKTKTRPRSTYRPQYTGPRSWEEPHPQPPLDVTTSQGPAIRYTDSNRNSQYTETPNFSQRQGTGQIEPEVRQHWSNTAESQSIRPENLKNSADEVVPFEIGTRILEAYGGGDPNDGSRDPNRYSSVKPNPSVTLPPNTGDKDAWEIFYPPLVRPTTTTESPTTTPVATTTTTTMPTPTPTSPPVPPTTTEAPGFWSKLGHSITNTYDKAKEKAKQIFG